jgi:hypothetical protein
MNRELKMRITALVAAALLSSATAAAAAPASVTVTIGPDLQKKAIEKYGVRDVDRLASELRKDVERELARTGAYDGSRIELVLVDAQPNRPTFKQMSDKPGLSFESFGIGGARIEGQAIAPGGAATPVRYSYYETDIRQSRGHSTWSDAQWTMNRFAYRLARGKSVASR